MSVESSHPGTTTTTEKWLVTRNAARSAQLPGRLLLPQGREWLNVDRVILLLPGVPMRIEQVAQMFEALDLPRRTQIILAELAGTGRDQSRRRQIDLLLARLQQTYPAACGKRLYEPDWLAAMRAFAGRSDLLIVPAGQYLAGRPLIQTLLSTLNLSVLEISGMFPPWPVQLMSWIKRSLFNLFPFLVVGLFFWAQSRISSETRGLVSIFAIGATIVVEFTIIFIWSLFLD